MLPLTNTSCSKFTLLRLDLFARKMSPAKLNSLFTAAELGRGVVPLEEVQPGIPVAGGEAWLNPRNIQGG
ncbi:hypothetical protein E2C01_076417 [Portunus trituberculatus]|uniref:Uncharacterized protein n=1 Tax=Portunus trituberculatus TaxID=210409 RepID=A0A5B7IHL6_PORTR|nr:hypothetical protein [Portunus trituberculatus]